MGLSLFTFPGVGCRETRGPRSEVQIAKPLSALSVSCVALRVEHTRERRGRRMRDAMGY